MLDCVRQTKKYKAAIAWIKNSLKYKHHYWNNACNFTMKKELLKRKHTELDRSIYGSLAIIVFHLEYACIQQLLLLVDQNWIDKLIFISSTQD